MDGEGGKEGWMDGEREEIRGKESSKGKGGEEKKRDC